MVLERIRRPLVPFAHTFLRVVVGVVMVSHGWDKISEFQKWIGYFDGMGFANPKPMLIMAIAGEFFGGLGVLVGLLTPVAALGVVATMAVAIVKVHLPNGLRAANNGFEYPLTLLAAGVYFAVVGGGSWSLDGLIARFRGGPRDEAAGTVHGLAA